MNNTPDRPPFNWRRYFFLEATGAPYLTALATIFLGVAAFWQGNNALKLARQANLTSRNAFRLQAEATLRPVVQREETSVTMPDDSSVVIHYSLLNTGESPARKLRTGRSISASLHSEVLLNGGEDEGFVMLLPAQTRTASTFIPHGADRDSFFVHSFMLYEYRLPVPQAGDSVITYVYAETALFDIDDQGLVQLGAEELELRESVRACTLVFHHPYYAVTGVR